MKKFKTQEIRDLLNQVYREEICFSIMVDILNDMVSEVDETQFKDGDFVVGKRGDILIFKKKEGDFIYDHAYLQNGGTLWVEPNKKTTFSIERHATEEEKQKLLDALAKEGKRWNEERKCIEDIPKRKFKAGDKVTLKSRCVSKTDLEYLPFFDKYIGERLEVVSYTESGNVQCNNYFYFHEDWLEPCVEELKKGDLAIFWDNEKEFAVIKPYGRPDGGEEDYFQHRDQNGFRWRNAIKFESKEQFNRLINGEI